jgi:hypothetical protein
MAFELACVMISSFALDRYHPSLRRATESPAYGYDRPRRFCHVDCQEPKVIGLIIVLYHLPRNRQSCSQMIYRIGRNLLLLVLKRIRQTNHGAPGLPLARKALSTIKIVCLLAGRIPATEGITEGKLLTLRTDLDYRHGKGWVLRKSIQTVCLDYPSIVQY